MSDRYGRGRCDGILNGDVVGCCLPRLDSLCWWGLDEKASWAWTECVSVVGSFETMELSGVGGGFFGRIKSSHRSGRVASARSAAALSSPTSDQPPWAVSGPVPPSENRPSSNQSSYRHESMDTECWATYSGLMENRRSPECCTRPQASPLNGFKSWQGPCPMRPACVRHSACLILAFSQASGK
jgi:hypothetical protein